MRSVTLLMAVHNHQPVGNFGFVFEEAYAKAYDPFLRVLERHPDVRLALHYSGCLLDWLLEHHPAFVDRVRALVERGQVELLASGYYEPILPVIPEADRQGQIAQMRVALREHFGAEGCGLWLTERVWEPELPATLAQAGIRYTMVDVNQFAAAKRWLPPEAHVEDEAFWDLLGCYTTESSGSSVLVFPGSKRLRYWMPFQAVEWTIEFLRRLKREAPVAITFADDGEKFGLWPNTHRWVYEEGWLDQFFNALERERAWLSTATFREYADQVGPCGTVYLPCGSYEEMLEWSGGSFRNFFTKYPEANAMQQKMLRLSRQLQALRARARGAAARLVQDATRQLYTAQCNCAYWHGVFGGLYLTHLRRAVYAHLIAAEQLARQASQASVSRSPRRGGLKRVAVDTADLDGDGRDEVSLRTDTMGLLVDPADGGSLTAWDLYGPRLNLLDTLSRRPEAYHEKLRTKHVQPAANPAQGVASIHEALGVKEEHLEAHLVYDDHRRSAFLDFGLQSMPALAELTRSTWGERRLWSPGAFQWELSTPSGRAAGAVSLTMIRDVAGGRIRKTINLSTDHPTVEQRYTLEGLSVPVVALEFNVALRDERYLKQAQQHAEVTRFDLSEPAVGARLQVIVEPAARLCHFPVETISESEGGLERTYQGLCLVFLWTVDGAPTWNCRLQWTVG